MSPSSKGCGDLHLHYTIFAITAAKGTFGGRTLADLFLEDGDLDGYS
jgi:hypothetical protein